MYEDLHDFGGTVIDANGKSEPDGAGPAYGGVVIDATGNLYGTASFAGPNGYSGGGIGSGMLWEYTSAGKYVDLHDFGGTVTYPNGSSGPDGAEP